MSDRLHPDVRRLSVTTAEDLWGARLALDACGWVYEDAEQLVLKARAVGVSVDEYISTVRAAGGSTP